METSERLSRMAENTASIAAVPWEVLSDGPARFLLMEMAQAGLDVFVRVDADGTWLVQVGGQVMTCAEWSAKFAV